MVRWTTAVVVLAVLAGGAYAYGTGMGPFAEDEDTTGFPDGAPGADEGDGDAADGGSRDGTSDGTDGAGGPATDGDPAATEREPTGPPFAFDVLRIEECGRTCRDVTAAVTNRQATDATDVTVYSRIYVGNSTASDDLIWSGQEPVGTLPAGASHRSTDRVELTLREGLAVQNADGWITVRTDVESSSGVETFTQRYRAA
jgi:hypothetical protein